MRIAALLAGSLLLSGAARFQREDRRDRIKSSVDTQTPSSGSSAYVSPYLVELAAPTSTAFPAECTCPASVSTDTGDALTFTRASSAQCLTSSNTYVTCATNQPIIETAGSWRGIRVEGASTNLLLRSDELDNAAWTATAAVTANAYTGPMGATMEQLNDSSAAAIQGVSQSVSASSAGFYYASCWLRSDSATVARVTFTGTGNSGGDSACNFNVTSTPSRFVCLSGSYGGGLSAISLFVGVGSASATTGTIGVGSCQLERNAAINTLGGYDGHTSYIPTTSAQVTRAASSLRLTVPAGITNADGCMKVSTYWAANNGTAPEWVSDQSGLTGIDNVLTWGSQIARKCQFYDGTNAPNAAAMAAALKNGWVQCRGGWSTTGSALEVAGKYNTDAPTTNTGSYDGTMGLASASLRLGSNFGETRFCNCLIGPTILHTAKTSCPLVTP